MKDKLLVWGAVVFIIIIIIAVILGLMTLK